MTDARFTVPTKGDGGMVRSTARLRPLAIVGYTLALALLLIAIRSGEAQELPPLQLDVPVLPPGETAPQPVVSYVPNQTGAIGSAITHPAPAMMPNMATGMPVQPVSFDACEGCGSIACGGCYSPEAGFQCPPSGLGMWVRADYLIWYEKESNVIPLVTSSTGFTANPQDLLTLPAAETTLLFGGEDFSDNPLDGWRVEVGAWLDAAATSGIMGRYFDVSGKEIRFSRAPGDVNFLGIPFFDPDIAGEDALDLTIPNERTGRVDINLTGDVKGFEILGRRLGQTGSNYRIDWLYGYRHFSLDETLNLSAATLTTGGNIAPLDTLVEVNDRFDAESRFHGFDFGLTGHSHEGCWSLDFLLKVALGSMNKEVDINGSQRISVPGIDPVINVGGLFSQESNIGKNDESSFAVIPEFNVNLGYGITPNLDFTVGYTFLFVSNVVRVGNAIDRVVDPGLIADLDPINSNRPLVDLDGESYWLHGLNLGFTGRF